MPARFMASLTMPPSAVRVHGWGPRRRRHDGSAAIAVLIMAALGALMWVGFTEIWDNASTQTTDQINTIGANGP